jgi:hypothetical protein
MKKITGMLLALGLASAANAAIIAGYDFGTPSLGTLGPTEIADGFSASNISGSGAASDFVLQQTIGDNTGTYIGADGVTTWGSTEAGNFSGTANDATGGSLAGAITNKDYVTITITAGVAGTLDIGGFSIAAAIAGDKSAENFNVLAQVNGGAAWAVDDAIFADDQVITAAQGLNDWDDYYVDLSDNTALQGITSVEFRVYFWGGSGTTASSRTDFDQIVVEGIVAIPEPTVMAMLGLTGFGFLVVRRFIS